MPRPGQILSMQKNERGWEHCSVDWMMDTGTSSSTLVNTHLAYRMMIGLVVELTLCRTVNGYTTLRTMKSCIWFMALNAIGKFIGDYRLDARREIEFHCCVWTVLNRKYTCTCRYEIGQFEFEIENSWRGISQSLISHPHHSELGWDILCRCVYGDSLWYTSTIEAM